MGRWDTLKPNENGGMPKKSNNSVSKWPYIKDKQDQSGTIKGTDKNRRPWTIDLTEQLQSHYKQIDESKLASALNQIRELKETANTETAQENVSLVHLVRLAEIDDETIQTTVLTLFGDKINDPNQNLREQELVECIGILSGTTKARSRASGLSLQCLIKLTSTHANKLHAEDTVQQVVGHVFVPELQVCPGDEANQISICATIQRLLSYQRFASAMLAPLVQDVSINGDEETTPNIVRRDLFRSLQNLLFKQAPSYSLKSKACSTLATMIETSQSTDEGRNSMTTAELDQRNLDNFIIQNLDVGLPLYLPCLLLLKSLLSTSLTASHYSKLVFTTSGAPRQSQPSNAKTARCRFCSCDMSCSNNPFLRSVHKAISNKASGIALECTAKMIAALPLNLWFGQQQPRVRGMPPSSGFHRQVVNSLIHVFDVARCAVWQKCDWHHSLDKLVTTLFNVVPWNNDTLMAAGQELWSTIAKTFLDTQNATVASVMIATLGGQVTPQGTIIPMPVPIRRWLTQQESGAAFIMSLLSDIRAGTGRSSSSSDVLCAVLRTNPNSALLIWEEFRILVQGTGTKNRNTNDCCMYLLEAFLSGRRNFPMQNMDEHTEVCKISELAFSVLEAGMNDTRPKHICRYLNCYSLMLHEDWNFLELDQPRFTQLIDAMMELCDNPNDSIRRDACKALGEFSSAYLTKERLSPRDVPIPTEIANQVCTVMIKVLKHDKSAAVRSMSIFALGNVAVAIMDHYEIVTAKSAVEITNVVYEALNESNDKVVGNAIRSMGHWGNIVARMPRSPIESQQLSRCLVQVLDSLSHRVDRTFAVASIDQQTGMTWRERSAAKKHGWGACYSLGRVFAGMTSSPDSVVEQESLLRAVEKLVRCIHRDKESASLSLSEKVVVAAMTSLRAMKPCQLGALSGKSGLVGEALVGSCMVLFSEGTNVKLQQEGHFLLGHLLSCAGIADATLVVKHDDITKTMLESLYGWMVEHGMEGRAFEIFALAFQRPIPSSKHDLSLEQRFASRALSQYKKAQMISLTNDDDDYDEL